MKVSKLPQKIYKKIQKNRNKKQTKKQKNVFGDQKQDRKGRGEKTINRKQQSCCTPAVSVG